MVLYKCIHMWVFTDEDGVTLCIHLYFYRGVDLVDDESAAILVAEEKQQRTCDMKTGHLLCCRSEFGISGCLFVGNPDEDGSEQSSHAITVSAAGWCD